MVKNCDLGLENTAEAVGEQIVEKIQVLNE